MLSKRWFDAFQDMSTDFRVGPAAMHGVRFAVYSLGSSEYDENWCKAGQEIYDGFLNMGATPAVPFGKGLIKTLKCNQLKKIKNK
jgi:flavodoxin